MNALNLVLAEARTLRHWDLDFDHFPEIREAEIKAAVPYGGELVVQYLRAEMAARSGEYWNASHAEKSRVEAGDLRKRVANLDADWRGDGFTAFPAGFRLIRVPDYGCVFGDGQL